MSASSKMLRVILAENHVQDDVFCGAEVGVHDGRTSELLLRRFPNLRLLMVDWWQDCGGCHRIVDPEQDLLLVKRRTEFAVDRRLMLVADSAAAARFVALLSLDWVYIDAGHSYDDVKRDLMIWVPRVRVGGLVLGHDYIDNSTRRRIGKYKHLVKKAVDEYAHMHGYEVRVRGCHTFQFRKTH